MKALTVKDLARTEELDRTALAAVRGGMKMGSPGYKFGDVTFAPSYDSSIDAKQSIMQMQEVFNPTATESAFVSDLHVDNHVSQDARNKIIG